MSSSTGLRGGAYLTARRVKTVGRHLARRVHETDYLWFRRHAQEDGLFVDVGANIGQSMLSVRTVLPRARVVALEPNPVHAADLRFVARIVRRADVVPVAAGASRGRLELHVPWFRGVPLTGEASLSREAVMSSDTLAARVGRAGMRKVIIRTTVVDVCPLDDLRLQPRWMKIDVQGSADEVIRGALSTLEEHRPTLLIESEGRTNSTVSALLAGLGYEPMVYMSHEDRLVPFEDQGPQNIFYITAERGIPRSRGLA